MSDQPNGTTAPVTCEGAVTFPEWVRDSLGLDGTGRIAFVETDDGSVVIRRVRPLAELRGHSRRV